MRNIKHRGQNLGGGGNALPHYTLPVQNLVLWLAHI